MPSGLGVLAAGISSGTGGAIELREGARELKEKYAWADRESQIRREENLIRFGQEKEKLALGAGYAQEQARLQSGLGVSSAAETRRLKMMEGIEANKGALKAKMEVMGSSPENIQRAMDFLDKGGELVAWTGKPGEPLSTEDVERLTKAVNNQLGEDASSSEKLELFKIMETNRTAGAPGILTKAAKAKEAVLTKEQEAAKQSMISTTTSDLSDTLVSDPKQAVSDFQDLYNKRPDIAEATLVQLEASGGHGIRREDHKEPGQCASELVGHRRAGRIRDGCGGYGSGGK